MKQVRQDTDGFDWLSRPCVARLSVGLFILCVAILHAHAAPKASPTQEKETPADARTAYAQLLGLFPEARQGFGIDSFEHYLGDQPMTLGFVVSAEAIHYQDVPNDDSRRRVKNGVRWLLDNRDLDKDGAPGWGIPQPWDTWRDGTENPANHPYTITTAIVTAGLLDALQADALWNEEQKAEIHDVLIAVFRRWCNEVWSDGYEGGYFWYSPRPEDDVFGINASSMFLASLTRMIAEHGDRLTDKDKALFSKRRDALAKAIVSTVKRRDGAPFWDYAAPGNRYHNTHPNDLVHHVYTLWGIETYRDAKGSVTIPWSRSEAIQSVNEFYRNGIPFEHAPNGAKSDKNTAQPARLWGIGMALAFYAKWDAKPQAEAYFRSIQERYGTWPRLHLYPATKPGDGTFYPRHAAHVLYGLSLLCHRSE